VFFNFVIDVYSGKIVGWQFAARMRTTLERAVGHLALHAVRNLLAMTSTP
jgi:transposase InsO family protein